MNNFKSALLEFGETVVVSFVLIFLIYRFIASIEIVSGSSMDPNFETGDRILVDKVSIALKPYQRGEVVVLTPPNEDGKHFIKRVIGLPGDIFKIFGCKVYITNSSGQFMAEESYLYPNLCTQGGVSIKEGRSMKLGPGEYVVLGDNRPYSVDSRFFGVVTKKNLVGRVVFRFWPTSKAGFIY